MSSHSIVSVIMKHKSLVRYCSDSVMDPNLVLYLPNSRECFILFFFADPTNLVSHLKIKKLNF